MGWDGSMGVPHMGHDFICVSLVAADYPEALPVYDDNHFSGPGVLKVRRDGNPDGLMLILR